MNEFEKGLFSGTPDIDEELREEARARTQKLVSNVSNFRATTREQKQQAPTPQATAPAAEEPAPQPEPQPQPDPKEQEDNNFYGLELLVFSRMTLTLQQHK